MTRHSGHRASFTQLARASLAVLAAGTLVACGRQERTIAITSEPPGAVVWLNDYELGRTPVETDFTFFGVYDVRLSKPGYEPLLTSREAQAPLHEQPGIDLVAAALPGVRRTRIEWHFVLAPVAESADPRGAEDALIERAKALREQAAAEWPAR
ncbi:MAG: PEGA domain-containing protein [Phycisphaerae bacterium]|nr:PEGA domain-containing protein [Phycisphaerae bacterium]